MLRTYVTRSDRSETKTKSCRTYFRVPTSIYPQKTLVSFDIDTFFTDILVPSFSIMTSQNTNDILAGIEKRLIAFSALCRLFSA
jgi:hypothetical protein